MIRLINPDEFASAAEVIRASFMTVAKDLGFTEQSFPGFTAFSTTAERLRTQYGEGRAMYGLYEEDRLIGFVALSLHSEGIYELNNLAVLPEYRHKGYGKQLLDFCKVNVKKSCGSKIIIGIVEENTVLKNWYSANGFTHTGTKKFNHMPITVGFMECEV